MHPLGELEISLLIWATVRLIARLVKIDSIAVFAILDSNYTKDNAF